MKIKNTFYNRKAKIAQNAGLILFLLICSLGAAFLVVVSALKYGPGMTHDSAAYMYAAESLIKGKGLQYFGYPSPFIQWPPLYPMLMAVGSLAGINAGTSAIIINSLAFALIVAFAGRWMFSRFSFLPIAAGGSLLLLLSLPLLQVSRYMWTEILFILFFLIFYLEFEKFLLKGGYGSLALAAVFSALACIERYAGVTVIAAAGLFLLFTKKKPVKRIADAAFYGIISVLPLSIWVLRNYIVSGTLLGVRLPSAYPLKLNIKRSMLSVYTWVQPENLFSGHLTPFLLFGLKAFSILVPLLIFAAFLITFGVKLKKPANEAGEGNLSGFLGRNAENLLPIAFFTVYTVIYMVYLIASATKVAFEPINSRYLIPVYLPILLSLLTAADYIIRNAGTLHRNKGKGAGKSVKLFAMLLLALYLVYPAVNTAAAVLESYRHGAGGYASDAVQKQDGFVRYMENNPDNTYFSNNSDIVYTLSGIRTYSPPKKDGPYMYGIEQFKKKVLESKNSYIIWFNNGVPSTLYSLQEIGELFTLEEAESFEYAKVYRILK